MIILHGLFGTLDNWQTLARQWADDLMIFAVDQRNHGRSPHTDAFDYQLLAEDIRDFMESQFMHRAHLLGHSMGGKAAMQVALEYPDQVDRLVVVDMGVRGYPGGHEEIFKALFALDLVNVKSRKAADAFLAARIEDAGVRQFLLKNLTRNKAGGYAWKANVQALHDNYAHILAPISGTPFEGPTLFIRGAESRYVQDQDIPTLQQLFPNSRVETVADAGHWVHAEQPEAVYRLVRDFLVE